MKKFAERLKNLRIERGLSQRELAKALGLTQGAITHWESGIRSPSGEAIILISKYFGVTSDYLLGLED